MFKRNSKWLFSIESPIFFQEAWIQMGTYENYAPIRQLEKIYEFVKGRLSMYLYVKNY